MHESDLANERRQGERFNANYVLQRVVDSVDKLAEEVKAMALKSEVGAALEKLDGKVDDLAEKMDARLSAIEKNQLPPWAQTIAIAIFSLAASAALEWFKTVFTAHIK